MCSYKTPSRSKPHIKASSPTGQEDEMDTDNGQETVKESVLVRVFEMLVERLTTLEKKIDRLEESMENEQTTRYGRLNSF